MSIGWSTAAILVLLLPGFAFFAGFLSTERISRDTSPRSTIGQLAGTVFVSFFTHAVLLVILLWLDSLVRLWPPPDLELSLRALLGGLHSSESVVVLATNVSQNLFWITSYVALSSLAGFFAGRGVGSLALANPDSSIGFIVRRLRFLVEHRWAYDLFPDRSGSLTPVTADVLTRASSSDCWLLYSGAVFGCGLDADGRIGHIILHHPNRRLMKLAEGGIERSPRVLVASLPEADEETGHDFLYLPSDQIANVYISRFRITGKIDVTSVEKAISQVEEPRGE